METKTMTPTPQTIGQRIAIKIAESITANSDELSSEVIDRELAPLLASHAELMEVCQYVISDYALGLLKNGETLRMAQSALVSAAKVQP